MCKSIFDELYGLLPNWNHGFPLDGVSVRWVYGQPEVVVKRIQGEPEKPPEPKYKEGQRVLYKANDELYDGIINEVSINGQWFDIGGDWTPLENILSELKAITNED